MRTCIECGSTKNVYSKAFGVDLCPNCTQMWKKHPQHELPGLGEVKYDEMGRPICHICGRAFDKLLAHVKQRHKMDPADYKRKFELDSGKGIVSEKTRTILQQHVKDNYEVVVLENLKTGGVNTRFKNGDPGRTKDKVRLQTKNVLSNNFKNIGSGRSIK